MTPPHFHESVVLITGAGSGIGRATSVKMAVLGANLAICDINEASLRATAEMCANEQSKQSHHVQAFDVVDTTAANNFVAAVMAKFGRIDHIFNCAGINPTQMALETVTDEYFFKLMNTNVKGTFNITRACIPHLKTGASFVNASSISGIRPSAGTAVYAATKAALIGFSKSMALELGPKGIRTNVVAPGGIHTPTNASVVAGAASVQAFADKVALGRLGTAEEVADVVAFLFGPEARYMNGSVIEVNGGLR